MNEQAIKTTNSCHCACHFIQNAKIERWLKGGRYPTTTNQKNQT